MSVRSRVAPISLLPVLTEPLVSYVCFVVDDQTDTEITVCNVLHTHATICDKYNKFQSVNTIEERNVIVSTAFIKVVCICMNIYNNMYVCPLPNLQKY